MVAQSSSTFRSRKADQPIYILRLKKIEQGQLLYPKIFPLILSRFPLTRLLELHTGLGFCTTQDISLHCWPKLGFEFAQGFWTINASYEFQESLWTPNITHVKFQALNHIFWSINWTVDLEISYIGEKVNCGQFTIKPHKFWTTSTL